MAKKATTKKSPTRKVSKKKAPTRSANKPVAKPRIEKEPSEQIQGVLRVHKEFVSVFKQLFSQPKSFFLILLFDVLCLVTLFFVSNFLSNLAQLWFSPAPASFLGRALALVFVFVSVGMMLFVVTFFKYCVLDSLINYVRKQEFSFNGLKELFLLNGALFGVALVLMFLLQALFYPLKATEHVVIAFLYVATLLILLFLFSWLASVSHVLLYGEKRASLSLLWRGWKKVLGNISSLTLFTLISICYYAVFLALFALFIGLPLKQFYFTSQESFAYYPLYVGLFGVLSAIVLYVLFQINRLYFVHVGVRN